MYMLSQEFPRLWVNIVKDYVSYLLSKKCLGTVIFFYRETT